MTIKNRLSKLEKFTPHETADPFAKTKLQEFMASIYERINGEDLDEGWVSRQSPATILSYAMHSPLPLSEAVVNRISDIAAKDNATGKIAQYILEVM